MPPDKIESLPPGSGGPQGTAIAVARDCNISLRRNPTAAQELVDRRTSTSGLSVSVRDVRIRLARVERLPCRFTSTVSRDSEAALLSLELDDDEGLEHHLRRVVDGVRLAALKYRDLNELLVVPATNRGRKRATAA